MVLAVQNASNVHLSIPEISDLGNHDKMIAQNICYNKREKKRRRERKNVVHSIGFR